MERYEGHSKNENRPETADKKRLVDLVGIEIEPTTLPWHDGHNGTFNNLQMGTGTARHS
jgi:hypothetical protein